MVLASLKSILTPTLPQRFLKLSLKPWCMVPPCRCCGCWWNGCCCCFGPEDAMSMASINLESV